MEGETTKLESDLDDEAIIDSSPLGSYFNRTFFQIPLSSHVHPMTNISPDLSIAIEEGIPVI